MNEKTCPHNKHISCGDCRLASLCLPMSLELSELNRVDDVVRRGLPLQKTHSLYRVGDDFTAIYAVRSGALKTLRLTSAGHEQITGFYLPGEILGLDGLGDGHHINTALALDTSSVCEIPFGELEDLSFKIPSLQRHCYQLMGREINLDQAMLGLLSQHNAEEKLASFLLSLSARYQRQQLSATHFILPMSRADIGNYLGLAIETVSRIFSQFKKNMIIDYTGRDVDLKNIDYLHGVAPVYG